VALELALASDACELRGDRSCRRPCLFDQTVDTRLQHVRAHTVEEEQRAQPEEKDDQQRRDESDEHERQDQLAADSPEEAPPGEADQAPREVRDAREQGERAHGADGLERRRLTEEALGQPRHDARDRAHHEHTPGPGVQQQVDDRFVVLGAAGQRVELAFQHCG